MSALPQDWLNDDPLFVASQVRQYQSWLNEAKREVERRFPASPSEMPEVQRRYETARRAGCLDRQVEYWFKLMDWEERKFWLTVEGEGIMTSLALKKFEPTGSLQITDLQDLMNISGLLAQCGYFKDASDPSKAAAKVMYGMELGISPIVALQSIYFFDGKPSISAQLLAGLVKKSGKYTYIVQTHTDNECVIEFFEQHPISKEYRSVGLSPFSMKDAQVAGLTAKDNWKKYPRNMMFARAMSNGVKMFCPDIFMGPIYTEGEIGEMVNTETGEIISMQSQIRNAEIVQNKVPQLTQAGADALAALPPAIPTASELKAKFFAECDKRGVTSKENKILLLDALYGAKPDSYKASVYSAALGRTEEQWAAAIAELFDTADPDDEDDAADHIGEEADDALPGMNVPPVQPAPSGNTNAQVA